MSVLRKSFIAEVKEKRQEIAKIQAEIKSKKGKGWDFFDDQWVDLKPFQASLKYDWQRRTSICQHNSRHISVTLPMQTLKEAAEFANHFKRSPISRVSCRGTASELPGNVLDHGYEHPNAGEAKRERHGDFVLLITGGKGHHSCELRFFVVEDDTPLSRYVAVVVQIEQAVMFASARRSGHGGPGSWEFSQEPNPSRLVYNTQERPRFCTDGSVASGSYRQVYCAPPGLDPLQWVQNSEQKGTA